MLRPLSKRVKTLLFVFLTPVVLFLLLWAYDSINRTLHPPQDTVIDLCPPDGKASNSAEKKDCRWVVPVKYHPIWNLDKNMVEFAVPWSDIDPSFPSDGRALIGFWLESNRYEASIRLKKREQNQRKTDVDERLYIGDISYYFSGFDDQEVSVHFYPSGFQALNPTTEILRPLGKKGTLHIQVSLPKLESEAAFELYFKQNIRSIDQKLMQFISQWH
jgi:hypothetical protein